MNLNAGYMVMIDDDWFYFCLGCFLCLWFLEIAEESAAGAGDYPYARHYSHSAISRVCGGCHQKDRGYIIELLFPTPYQTFVICEMLIKMSAVFIVPTVSPCRKYVRHLLGEECQCLFRYVLLILDIY